MRGDQKHLCSSAFASAAVTGHRHLRAALQKPLPAALVALSPREVGSFGSGLADGRMKGSGVLTLGRICCLSSSIVGRTGTLIGPS